MHGSFKSFLLANASYCFFSAHFWHEIFIIMTISWSMSSEQVTVLAVALSFTSELPYLLCIKSAIPFFFIIVISEYMYLCDEISWFRLKCKSAEEIFKWLSRSSWVENNLLKMQSWSGKRGQDHCSGGFWAGVERGGRTPASNKDKKKGDRNAGLDCNEDSRNVNCHSLKRRGKIVEIQKSFTWQRFKS